MEGDQWLPPDTAFLQQHMQQNGGQPWGGGGVVLGAGEEQYAEYYEEPKTWQRQEQPVEQQLVEQHPVEQLGGQKQGHAGSKHGSPGKKIAETMPSVEIPTGGYGVASADKAEEVGDESFEMNDSLSDNSFEMMNGDDEDDEDADF